MSFWRSQEVTILGQTHFESFFSVSVCIVSTVVHHLVLHINWLLEDEKLPVEPRALSTYSSQVSEKIEAEKGRDSKLPPPNEANTETQVSANFILNPALTYLDPTKYFPGS